MTPEEQANVDAIEKERRKREALLLALLLFAIGGSAEFAGTVRRNRRSALRFATDALSMGHDPVTAVRRVIYGDAGLHLPGLRTVVTRAMEDAWVNGYQRAFILAKQPLPVYVHGPSRFAAAAGTLLDGLYASLGRLIEQAVAEARAAGKTTMQVVDAVRDAFVRYGWTRQDPQTVNPESKGSPGFAAAAVATNAVLQAWGDGLNGGLRHPSVTAKLTALRHISVIDDRTSEWCNEMSGRDGLTLAPSDPYWLTNWVPLHTFCRSIIVPIFKPVELSDTYPILPPQAGYGLAPGGIGFGA